jgi:uncharacterized protein (DUF433 family)
MDTYQDHIWLDPDRRSGKPCVRGTRITVGDVLGWLAASMAINEIILEYPQLTHADVLACLAYAAAREQNSVRISLAA